MQFVSFKLRVLDRTTRSLSSYWPLPLFRLLFRSLNWNGCLFSTSRQQRGWCTILKAIYTNALCCHAYAFPHTCMHKVHIYCGTMTKKYSRAAILVSKEHLTLFFYPSLFLQRRPFTFRPSHSSSSSALPSSLIKAWRLSAKRTSPGTPVVAEHYEWDDEGAREIQIEGRTIIARRTVCWTPYNGNFLLVLIKKLCDRNGYRGSTSSSVNNHSYCSFPIRKEKKKRACLDTITIILMSNIFSTLLVWGKNVQIIK